MKTDNNEPAATLRLDAVSDREFAIMEFTEQVIAKMKELGLKRSVVADRLGRSKAYVTQLLNGPNMTFQTASELARAVGLRFHVRCENEVYRYWLQDCSPYHADATPEIHQWIPEAASAFGTRAQHELAAEGECL